MRKAVQKTKVIKADPGIASAFSKIIGSQFDVEIAYPRYKEYKQLSEQCLETFVCLNSVLGPAFDDEKRKINEWLAMMRAANEEYFGRTDETKFPLLEEKFLAGILHLVDDSKLNSQSDLAKELSAFTELYAAMKNSNLIKHYIQICDKLSDYRSYYSDQNKLNRAIIFNIVVPEWTPIPFAAIDFKRLLCLGVDSLTDFILQFLNRLYTTTFKIFQLHDTPDIDVEKFAQIFMSMIAEVKKIPELSRCRNAFRILEESVDLLKKNFGGYYKSFINVGNSNIIMESFISDIIVNIKDTNPMAIAEFNKIMRFFRTKMSSQIKDPAVKQYMDKLAEMTKDIDKYAKNINEAAQKTSEPEGGGDDVISGDVVDFNTIVASFKSTNLE